MVVSHPAWVCGLKLSMVLEIILNELSHPAWVCGLKHVFDQLILYPTLSHPAWVCGLKQQLGSYETLHF